MIVQRRSYVGDQFPARQGLVLIMGLPWQFFATSLSESSNSLILNTNLVSKVYFPRLIVPAGSVITSFVDFLISFAILVAIVAWYQYWPDWRIVFLPLFIVLAFGAAIGAGLWLYSLNVQYRDFRYIVPFIVQFGVYVSPVGFSSSVVPERWRLLYSLNPMVGVTDGFRWALLRGESPLYWPGLLTSIGIRTAGIEGTRAISFSGTPLSWRELERSMALLRRKHFIGAGGLS